MDMNTLSEVRRLVAEGSIKRGDKFIWVCPICCARVTSGVDLTLVHQAARNHSLVHAQALASPRNNRTPERRHTHRPEPGQRVSL